MERPFVKSPSFQIYPADFLADKNTIVMTTPEIGAYWLLLLVCWQENGLPDDVDELAVVARLPVKQFQPIWDRHIQRCFQKREDGKWTHKRLEKERQKQKQNREKRHAAAKSGANARWQTHANRITETEPRQSADVPMNALSDFSFQSSDCRLQTADADRIDRGYPFDHFAVIAYERTMKPEPGLSIRPAEILAAEIVDTPESRRVWNDVLAQFTANDYSPRHAGNALDRYKKEMAKLADGSAPVVRLTEPERKKRQDELRERVQGNGTR